MDDSKADCTGGHTADHKAATLPHGTAMPK
jgi:hypothetical protein